jgi:hypothetical protein
MFFLGYERENELKRFVDNAVAFALCESAVIVNTGNIFEQP